MRQVDIPTYQNHKLEVRAMFQNLKLVNPGYALITTLDFPPWVGELLPRMSYPSLGITRKYSGFKRGKKLQLTS